MLKRNEVKKSLKLMKMSENRPLKTKIVIKTVIESLKSDRYETDGI